MGQQIERGSADSEALRRFTRCLLRDVHALERMLEEGMLESGVSRIGAEQEMVLVDTATWRPAMVGPELIEDLEGAPFTTEIGRWNIESNLDPLPFGGDCLSRMERTIVEHMEQVRKVAGRRGVDALLIGILPTIRKSDLTLENMTPVQRYAQLNETLSRMRGRHYDLNLRGIDELALTHDNVMLEACNTSFQVHFQVDPEHFAHRYNIAQAVAGPVLAAAVNSPLLGRYRLWSETRIGLFQQSLDTRTGPYERDLQPRVSFGTRWVDESVLEIYQEDIARYKVLFAVDEVEDPFEALEAGRAPRLPALALHTGTVYRWNRPVYGVMDGRPNLRIENRTLPAGPTPRDEVANAAFWFGLMRGLGEELEDVREEMEFEHARENFAVAAMKGLDARFTWLGGRKAAAVELILEELLPLARTGLKAEGIAAEDVDRYLGTLEERVRAERTGAAWLLASLGAVKQRGTRWEQVNALVAATLDRQRSGEPVHTWRPAELDEAGGWARNYLTVGQLMNTDLFTVNPEESLDLVANLMVWHRIRHVMVEDEEHRLLGLVSHRHLLRLVGRELPKQEGQTAPVASVMVEDPITVQPDTPTVQAIRTLREERISCLPVVSGEGRLVGVVTEDDFMTMAGSLLEEKLGES